MCLFFDSFSLFGPAVLSYAVKNRAYFYLRISAFVRKQKSVNISALPEECLLPIFDRIPLSELLRLDQVCLKWAMLLPSATLRRRTLVLKLRGAPKRFVLYAIPMNDSQEMSMEGGRAHRPLSYRERENTIDLPFLVARSFDEYLSDRYEFEDFFHILYDDSLGSGDGEVITEIGRLRHAALNGQLIEYFRYLFPNLEHLVVIHPRCPLGDLQLLIGLVQSWPLISLKLWIRTFKLDASFGHRPEKHLIGTLLLSINNAQQHSLRELTLDVTGHGPDHEYAFPIESFAFIGRLQVVKLYLGKFDRTNSIWNIIHRHGTNNNNLRQVSLGTANPVQVELNPKFAYNSKLAQLFMFTGFESVAQLSQICSRFSALTNVQVCLSWNISFGQLVTKLRSLNQMTTLKFLFYSEDFFGHVLQDGFALANGEQAQVLSLPQVKTLEIELSKRTHRDLDSFPQLVFPSVELIILAILIPLEEPEKACVLCQPNITGEPSLEKALECKRLLSCSLRNKFPNPGVRMYANGKCVTVTDTRLEAVQTVATLFTVFVGLPILFEKILTN